MKEQVVEHQKEEENLSSKIEKKDSDLSDIKGSLDDLKKNIAGKAIDKQDTSPVVQEKNTPISSESGESPNLYFDEKVSESSLENVVSRVDSHDIVRSKEQNNSSLEEENSILSTEKNQYLDTIQVIDGWMNTSHRVAAKEIAGSAKTLLGDIYKKDSNFWAEGVRSLAAWFLS